MKTTCTITFHASHNYGSMLQAYALQKTLNRLGYSNKIINLRTKKQRDIYPMWRNKPKTFKSLVKKILLFPYKNQVMRKYDLFENFLQNNLELTEEYSDITDLEHSIPQADVYISGSDQIWNTSTDDFTDLYFLPFINDKKKISYAPSFGPKNNIPTKYINHIKNFDILSVREKASADMLTHLLGRSVKTVLDPTLLLNSSSWLELTDTSLSKTGEDYVFIYSPGAGNEFTSFIKTFSRGSSLPLVSSNVFNIRKLYFNNVKYQLDSGPVEFLNLIKNARFVIAESFHAVVFSILFKKPFAAFNGLKDNRMNNILTMLDLKQTAIDENSKINIKSFDNIDFDNAISKLESFKNYSIDFLKEAVG